MSWDKNTINLSNLDAVVETLVDLGVDYEVSVLREFNGCGLNDDYLDTTPYKLRRLQYDKKVILEKAVLDSDCDTDDLITSHKFELDKEPLDWQPIIHTDINGQYTEQLVEG